MRDDRYEWKEIITIYAGDSEHGRSTQEVVCPFCNRTVKVYLWSFYGSGKKCDCGVVLVPYMGRRLK